ERRNDEVPRPDELAFRGLDADGAAAFDDDSLRLGHHAEFAAVLLGRRLQSARQSRGSATRQLRLGRTREQGGDVMAKTAHAQIDLAQPVEKQEAGPHRRMLELLLYKLKRRQRAHLEQTPAGMTALEQPASFIGWK